MREYWLHKYIQGNSQRLGFRRLEGPFDTGPDFKGVLAGRKVLVEAELSYQSYISHGHPKDWADILIVASLDPIPVELRERLPGAIINVDPQQVLEWSRPMRVEYRASMEEGRKQVIAQFPQEVQDILSHTDRMRPEKLRNLGYELMFSPWHTLAEELATLYAYHISAFPDIQIVRYYSIDKEVGWESVTIAEDDELDYWLNVAFAVASQFKIKPSITSVTWIDGLYHRLMTDGKLDANALKQLEAVIAFIESGESEDAI